ncbi:MAG: PaeR7I family type II restriction endonuclease [Chloroflexota bacterium]|nr:PaeR7I family type II restriction endonuclease [Chloroflexota bacterium]
MFAQLIQPHVFSDAVKRFWRSRDTQSQSQQQRGISDHGTRGAVTGGKQMDGFAETIGRLIVDIGVKPEDIYLASKRNLPGFFRPNKQWDLVVVSDGKLIAALELKSQVGPSFGNNFNNRTEEAMGTALDTWTAFREGVLGTSQQPWLGYLFLLEDCSRSRSPVKVNEPHFPVMTEFRGASYTKRYEVFCRKLVLERQYSAACFLTARRDKALLKQNYAEPATDLSARAFLSQLLKHVAPGPALSS